MIMKLSPSFLYSWKSWNQYKLWNINCSTHLVSMLRIKDIDIGTSMISMRQSCDQHMDVLYEIIQLWIWRGIISYIVMIDMLGCHAYIYNEISSQGEEDCVCLQVWFFQSKSGCMSRLVKALMFFVILAGVRHL